MRSRLGAFALSVILVGCGAVRSPTSAPSNAAASGAPVGGPSGSASGPSSAPATPHSAAPVAGSTDILNDGVTPGRTGQMPGPGVAANPKLLWQTAVGGAVDATPIVVDGQVIVGANDGLLYAFDLNTGAQRWKLNLGGPIRRAASAVKDTLFVSTTDHLLHAIDIHSHDEIWHAIDIATDAIPAIVGGLVLVGSTDHALVALERSDGRERWRVPVVGNAKSISVAGSIAYVTGDLDGQLYAVDTRAGAILWTFQSGANGIYVPAVIDDMVIASLLDDPGRDARVVALDARTGAELWTYVTPDGVKMGRLPVDATRVYTETWASPPTELALDRATGKLLWQSPIDATGAPSIVDGVLYASGATGGTMRAFDAATGTELWNFAAGRSALAPELAVSQGTVVFTTGAEGIGRGSVGAIAAAGDPRFAIAAASPTPAATALASPSPAPALVRYVREFRADSKVSLYLNVATDPSGNVWVVDNHNDRLLEFDSDGTLLRTLGSHGSKPGEFFFCVQPCDSGGGTIAFAPDGSFVVADGNNHRVQRFDAQGTPVSQFGRFGQGPGQFVNPCCVGLDPVGRIYVSDVSRNDIQVFSATGVYIRTIGRAGSDPGQFVNPGPPNFDAAGNLYVPDYANRRVQVFDASTGAVTVITSDVAKKVYLGYVQSVILDAHGNLFILDDVNGLVVLDPYRKLLSVVGTTIDNHSGLEMISLAIGRDGRMYLANVAYAGGPSSTDDVVELQLLPPLYP